MILPITMVIMPHALTAHRLTAQIRIADFIRAVTEQQPAVRAAMLPARFRTLQGMPFAPVAADVFLPTVKSIKDAPRQNAQIILTAALRTINRAIYCTKHARNAAVVLIPYAKTTEAVTEQQPVARIREEQALITCPLIRHAPYAVPVSLHPALSIRDAQ